MFAPGQVGTAKQTAEEARVERIENFVEMIIAAFGSEEALAAACVADEVGLARDGGTGREALVAQVVRPVDGLAIELGEKDVSDGVVDGVGCVLEDVGETDVQAAFAETDGGVE